MSAPAKKQDSPLKALIVVVAVALVCSILVSSASIALRPIKLLNQKLDRSRHIVALTGLLPADEALSNDEILQAVVKIDTRVLDIDTGDFDDSIDPERFDARAAASDPELSVAIPDDEDLARLGRRPRHAIVHLVWDGDELKRVILPIHGQGMWSTLYGLLALEYDLNTIGAVTFYEQAETAGLGDQITHPEWQLKWQGRQLFNRQGKVVFHVAPGPVDESLQAAVHQVDAISGATVTAVAVTRLVEFWFGPSGYLPFLNKLKNQPPTRQVSS